MPFASKDTSCITSVFLIYNEWVLSSLVFLPNVVSEARIRVQGTLEIVGEGTVVSGEVRLKRRNPDGWVPLWFTLWAAGRQSHGLSD